MLVITGRIYITNIVVKAPLRAAIVPTLGYHIAKQEAGKTITKLIAEFVN